MLLQEHNQRKKKRLDNLKSMYHIAYINRVKKMWNNSPQRKTKKGTPKIRTNMMKKAIVGAVASFFILMSFPMQTHAQEIKNEVSTSVEATETTEVQQETEDTTTSESQQEEQTIPADDDEKLEVVEEQTTGNDPPQTVEEALTLMQQVTEQTEVTIYTEQVTTTWMFFRTNTITTYYKIKLSDDLYTFIPTYYGDKETIVASMQAGTLIGMTLDGSNPLESVEPSNDTQRMQTFGYSPVQVGGSWQVPIFRTSSGRPVYCADGKLNFPSNIDNLSWNSPGDALGGAKEYIISNLVNGYEQNAEGMMQGDSIEQQAATQAAIWYNMAYHRGNSSLDWSTGSGSGAESALNSSGVIGDNMRYLVGKGTDYPNVVPKINGQESGTVSVSSSLETINGTPYQVSEWFEYGGGGTLSFHVPSPLKMQREDGTIYDGGDHSCNSGGKYRILNEDLKDDSLFQQTTSTDLKKWGILTAVVGGGYQSLVRANVGDPISTPSFAVQWEKRVGVGRVIKDDNNGSKLTGATFTYFLDKDCKVVAKDVNGKIATMTTVDGEATVPDLVVGDYYIHELKPDGTSGAPYGYMPMDKPVKVTIEAGKTTTFAHTNIMPTFKSFEFEKVIALLDGNVAGESFEFKIYRDYDDALVDTVTTGLDGKARTVRLPANRMLNNKEVSINYYAVETNSGLYVDLGKITLTGNENKDTGLITVPIVNTPKKVNIPVFKAVEDNIYNVKADGTVYGLFDKNGLKLQEGTIQNGTFVFENLTYEQLGLNISENYIQEIKTSNEALILDETKHYLPNIDWKDIKNGQTINIKGNSAKTPFINKFRPVEIGTQVKTPVVPVGETVTQVDTISYCGLIPGETYLAEGQFRYQDETGIVLLDVKAETTFVAESTCGTVDVIFTFDSRGLEGKSINVAEKVSHINLKTNVKTPVGEHDDITDAKQTFVVAKLVETGLQQKAGIIGAIIFTAALLSLAFIQLRRNFIKKEMKEMR